MFFLGNSKVLFFDGVSECRVLQDKWESIEIP